MYSSDEYFFANEKQGLFDKFDNNLDNYNILIPRRKVWSTLSLNTFTYFVPIVWQSLWFNSVENRTLLVCFC